MLFHYIDSNSKLAEVVDLIKRAKIVALDTEFQRETTYYPILSLVQVAVEGKIFLIDVLQKLDLTDFFALIADKNIIKIFHSCTQDLQIFHYYSNLLPQNIFDTQIMGNFCEFGFNLGYSEIVEKLFAQKLNKNQQRSDWCRRPLSSHQLEYAALDVVFLQGIYEIFLDKLAQEQKISWLMEEMDIFIKKSLFKKDEATYKDFTFRNKTAVEASQMRLLALLREKWAQIVNIPKRHLLKDEEIEKMVAERFCNKNLPLEMQDEIAQILDCQEEVIRPVPGIYMSERQRILFAKAKIAVEKIARENHVKEQFLLTTMDLKTIICQKNSLEKVLFGWRYDLLAEELKSIINL